MARAPAQPWGRAQWLEWCDQVEQGDEDKPDRFWDTMLKARIGAEMLRRWANKRHPQEMAKRAFADPPPEPEALAEADEDARFADAFLNRYCLVGGAEFFDLPPSQPYGATAFNRMLAKDEKRLRRHFGDKRNPLSYVFALHSPNTVVAITHEPGKSRFIDKDGRQAAQLVERAAAAASDRPIDMEVIELLRGLGRLRPRRSAEEAGLWLMWHAWLLQHPDRSPGWHWLVQTDQGMGKDLILLPIGLDHGDDYMSVKPQDLASPFNEYAEKHLISVSEMKEKGRDRRLPQAQGDHFRHSQGFDPRRIP